MKRKPNKFAETWNNSELRHKEHVLMCLVEARERAASHQARCAVVGFSDIANNIGKIVITTEAAIGILNGGELPEQRPSYSLASTKQATP